MGANDVATFLRDFGLPVTLLLALLYMLWRAGSWAGVNVLKPITDKHVEFVDKLAESQKQLSDTQERQAETLDAIAKTQEQQVRLGQENAAELRALRTIIIEQRRQG